MLLLLLLFFIGRSFFNLAKKHERNKWLFALLGVVVYYGMGVIGAIIIVAISLALDEDTILNYSDAMMGILGIPIGLLAVWGFYYFLRKSWEGNPKNQLQDLLDDSNF